MSIVEKMARAIADEQGLPCDELAAQAAWDVVKAEMLVDDVVLVAHKGFCDEYDKNFTQPSAAAMPYERIAIQAAITATIKKLEE